MFLYPLLWLLGYYNSINQAMADFLRELEGGWLEEVTLFPNQQLGLNINDYLCTEPEISPKLHHGNSDSDFSNIWNEWMGEKFDLSTIDLKNDWLGPHDDSEKISEEDESAILQSLMDCNFPASDMIPFENEIEATKYLENSGDINTSVTSTEISLSSPAAIVPEILLEFPNTSSEEIPLSPISSPSSVCSSYLASSPECFNSENKELVKSSTVLDFFSSEDSEYSSGKIDEKDFTFGPCQSSLKPTLKVRLSPYSTTSSTKIVSRKERKKVQNKEAAARYREKRRVQDQELSGEVSELEAKGKELKEKHDQLKNEISYLKSLMREMFKKRGLLK